MTTICRHIKINGQRCGSPALRDHIYCYYHRTLTSQHQPPEPETPTIIHPRDGGEPQLAITGPTLNLPALEDRESIQLAASMVIGALARNTLETKRAATLLYGLQVASSNARSLNNTPQPSYAVTETVLTPTGHEIAPDQDPEGEILFQDFVRSLEQDDDETEEQLSPAAVYLARSLSAA